MREQAATYQVEAIIAEGKCQRVGHDCSASRLQMRCLEVKVCDGQRNSFPGQLHRSHAWDFVYSGGYFEHREALLSRGRRNSLHQPPRRTYAAKPPVDAAQIAQ